MAPLGVVFAPISTHPSRPRRRHSAMRHYPGQSRRLSVTTRRARRPGVPSLAPPRGVGADDHLGPLLGTTCVASVGRGDYTPPSQIPSRNLAGGSHTPGAPRRPGRISLLRSPCRGRAPPRPAGEDFRPAPIPAGSQTPSTPRRGGPMYPPEHASLRDPPRADTSVGPYRSYRKPPSLPRTAEPRPYRNARGLCTGPSYPRRGSADQLLHSPFSIFHSQFLKKLPPPPCGGGGAFFSGRGRRASCPPGSSPRW